MERKTTQIIRRVIGDVNIFDLIGDVEGDWIEGIKSYMESYIKQFNLKNVILNIESVNKVGKNKVHDILQLLSIPKKSALYFDSPEIMKQFIHGYKHQNIKLCNSVNDILKIFGKDMLEKNKLIEFSERRKNVRLKTALFAKMEFNDKNDKIITTECIVTNLSKDGMFAEYLDNKSSLEIENLDYFKNLNLKITMQNIDPMVEKPVIIKGHILRIEFSGTQTGIAIQFDQK